MENVYGFDHERRNADEIFIRFVREFCKDHRER